MKRHVSIALCLGTVFTGCTDEVTYGEAESEANVPAPANMGRYCSMLWPGGSWAFAWHTNLVADPCKDLAGSSTTGVIQRAGMFSTNAINNVVLRCDGHLHLDVGPGGLPLTRAFRAAGTKKNCIFTVAPREMPVFGRPYSAGVIPSAGTGFDFARGYTVDAKNDYGDPSGSTMATEMSWKGIDRSGLNGWIDNHDGWDLNMLEGTKIYAVADGVVKEARYRDVSIACPWAPDKSQGEVFIEHVVDAGAGTTYDEKLLSYYAHFKPDSIEVTKGQVVKKGDLIGYSGTSGCSTGPHLHISASKLTNTAGQREFTLVINTDFSTKDKDQNSANNWRVAIEPRGFYAPKGFDPWGYRGFPDGALSTNLWAEGQAPPAGDY